MQFINMLAYVKVSVQLLPRFRSWVQTSPSCRALPWGWPPWRCPCRWRDGFSCCEYWVWLQEGEGQSGHDASHSGRLAVHSMHGVLTRIRHWSWSHYKIIAYLFTHWPIILWLINEFQIIDLQISFKVTLRVISHIRNRHTEQLPNRQHASLLRHSTYSCLLRWTCTTRHSRSPWRCQSLLPQRTSPHTSCLSAEWGSVRWRAGMQKPAGGQKRERHITYTQLQNVTWCIHGSMQFCDPLSYSPHSKIYRYIRTYQYAYIQYLLIIFTYIHMYVRTYFELNWLHSHFHLKKPGKGPAVGTWP